MISYTIWVIDDELSIREGIVMTLETEYEILSFADAESALERIKSKVPDLILLDIGLPGMDGIEALKKIKSLYPDLLIIMITAYEEIQTVIDAMKLGAYDYIIKPIIMPGLRTAIRNALESISLKKEVRALQERYLKENLPFFIGESRSIKNVMNFIGRVAKSPDTPILIRGETGTGKEMVATAIHYKSPNFKGPFIPVNCAAIPRELVESELFGYEKGAFSGADSSGKKGLIEAAENGTLFLDEVGDLNIEAQAKLLRFLEQREYYRIGGTKKNKIQTRVISATNKDLKKMIGKGEFRKDLYYRLNVIKVEIPSLNERKEDILLIARHFLYEFNNKFAKKFSGISQKAEKALMDNNWTGNVRELKNCIERGVLVGRGSELQPNDIGLEHLEPEKLEAENIEFPFPPLSSKGMDIAALQENMEKYYIKEALKISGGNEAAAARLLFMKVHNFRYRKNKFNIKSK